MPEDLWGRLTHNAGYKLLSALLACAIWLYVQGDEVADAKLKARLVWVLPQGLTTVEQLPRTVQVNVRGTRASLRHSQSTRVELNLDVSGMSTGEHALELDTLGIQGLPAGVEVTAVSPSLVRFVLDDLTTQRVELVPGVVGDPAPGFRVEGITLDPPVVEIAGPRGVVGSLDTLDIVPIDVSGIAADAIFDVQLDPPRSVSLTRDVRARAAVRVMPELERRVVSSVPVSVWRHPDWRPESEVVDVTLEGPSGLLRDMGTEHVAAFVHLPDRVEQSRYEAAFGPEQGVRLRVLHPGGDEVKVIDVQPPMITVVRQ